MIVDRRIRFPLDHRQDGGDQPARIGRREQGVRLWLLVRHDDQAPELRAVVDLLIGYLATRFGGEGAETLGR